MDLIHDEYEKQLAELLALLRAQQEENDRLSKLLRKDEEEKLMLQAERDRRREVGRLSYVHVEATRR